MTGSAPAPARVRHDDTRSEGLDNRLFVVVSAILIVLVLICITGLTMEIKVYWNGINQNWNGIDLNEVSTIKLAFARSLDAAILKTSGLFLGYLLIFTGALYVLRIATAHYRLSLTNGTTSGSLQTSSPGLVIITLGVLLVAVAILHTTAIDLTSIGTVQPAAKSDAQQQHTADATKAVPLRKAAISQTEALHSVEIAAPEQPSPGNPPPGRPGSTAQGK